ncbi:Mss4-like protein [Pisolithus marmoratus]|nr:Mss4-like protein [Pisolithus marmoratus]
MCDTPRPGGTAGSLAPEIGPDQSVSLPPGLFAALQRPSACNSTVRSLQDFDNGVMDVCSTDVMKQGVLTNKYDLTCPRTGCGCVILKRDGGMWVEGASVGIDDPNRPMHPDLTPLPVPPATAHWWLITPSPMEFENIGFTRAIQLGGDTSGPTKQLKWLICAECDLGPLGWTEVGGKEFWLACSRVKYKL